ncbi:MAG: helix-turn-helix transcriptional regulator [Gammaproteobacteria bacterium]|nr:helix-turn-helix transcriptional regulator [Gammaproteobacteria bacterium]
MRGLSLKALAERVGTSAPTLHRYETGWDRFEIRTLRRIAAALGGELEVRLLARHPEVRIGARDKRQLRRLLSPLFWDTELSAADLVQHRRWVLARVLMYGDLGQVRAVRRFYGDDAIREAVAQRGIDARTRNYWTTLLGGPDASQGSKQRRLEDRS